MIILAEKNTKIYHLNLFKVFQFITKLDLFLVGKTFILFLVKQKSERSQS